ncbi:DoxX family protein [Rhodococcus kronopolitis]|uniref:DoxX family protein n=1 Tax=Rhodococcus kronopolitis TaxID=1460226 RepID=A0ABV9FVZ9_9NOCA
MDIVAFVTSVALAVGSLGAALPKVRLRGTAWTALRDRGLHPDQVRALGGAEIVGGVGVLAGLIWWPVGVVAAAGLLVLMLSATAFHVKHGDFGNPDMRGPALYPAALAVLAAIVLVALFVAN